MTIDRAGGESKLTFACELMGRYEEQRRVRYSGDACTRVHGLKISSGKARMTDRCVVRMDTVMKQMVHARIAVQAVGQVRKEGEDGVGATSKYSARTMKEGAKTTRTARNGGARRW